MKKKFKRLITIEAYGIGVVEIILILVVLVGLVVIFRREIDNIVTSLIDNIKNSIETFKTQ